VESWMRKIETDPALKKGNQNQAKGDDDSVLKPINPAVTQIVLPTTSRVFKNGFGKAMSDAGRWLSEFILRIIKREKGNVKFKEE